MPVTVHASPCLFASFLSLAFQIPFPLCPSYGPGPTAEQWFLCYTVIHRVLITGLDTKYELLIQFLYYTSHFSCTPFLQPLQTMMVVGRDISETISHLRAAF